MARFRQSTIRDNIKGFLFGAMVILLIILAVLFFTSRDNEKDEPSSSNPQGNIYICSGCGKVYINQFPYTSPWEGCPAEIPSHAIVNIEETSRNGSIGGATPVDMFQRVTGNLSSRDDTNFYGFTIGVAGSVVFCFSFDGSNHGYTYLWDGVVYGIDGITVLNSGSIPAKANEEITFGTGESNLDPGTYYLKISAASGGNPFMNGYSDADYHITFRPKCAEHTTMQVLTAAPTCSQAGELTTVCSVCDEQISTDSLEPLDHIWSTWKTVDQDNLFNSICGEYSRVCALCGKEETDTLLFHFLDSTPKTDPNAVTVTEIWTESGTVACAAESFVKTVCSVCGNEEVEHTGAADHTYREWETIRISTCSTEGERRRTCAACGHVETETLDCIPHSYGEKVRISGSILDAPIMLQETCEECGYVNTVESSLSRWALPAIIFFGGVAAVGILFYALKVIHRQHRRTFKKRQKKVFKNIKLFSTKFTCPFCIREYGKSEVLYVCPDCGKSSQPGRFEKEPIGCKTPRCNGLATLRKCPYCGQIIPQTALETPNFPFSIVGVSNSGKTNYITVMLHELEKASGLRLVLGHQTKETLDRQNENFHRIYEEHTRPESTQAGEITPQIWYIKNLIKKRGSKVPTYTFTIFDGAGEDHENNLDPSSTVCRYINASKAIILAIDPLVLPKIRNSGVVDQDVLMNSLGGYRGEAKNAKDVINSVATYIKTARGIRATKMLDIPVAVVLTKFDTLINHKAFGPQTLIRNRSLTIRDGKVDMSEIKQVDQEIRNWLYQIGEGAFIDTLDSHFKEYYFFGVSSYGSPPKDAYTLSSEIRPHRVLDPILWLFKREKFID